MYNKLFSKIVTSSIWLEPTPTRIVWLMFIALMNEDGFVQFASVANVAHTARISDEEAEQAIKILEAPDPNSADDDNEGRRIQRVPGGWMILNAAKYRDLVTREMVKAQTRERVARHRAKLKGVTPRNAKVTRRNAKVTQSDTDTNTHKDVGASGSHPASDFVADLAKDPTYSGIDVVREFGKMQNWCKLHGKQPTQRRFVNWLNRSDKLISQPSTPKSTYGRNYMAPAREPTEAELEVQRKIIREASEKLKAQFKA